MSAELLVWLLPLAASHSSPNVSDGPTIVRVIDALEGGFLVDVGSRRGAHVGMRVKARSRLPVPTSMDLELVQVGANHSLAREYHIAHWDLSGSIESVLRQVEVRGFFMFQIVPDLTPPGDSMWARLSLPRDQAGMILPSFESMVASLAAEPKIVSGPELGIRDSYSRWSAVFGDLGPELGIRDPYSRGGAIMDPNPFRRRR